jgi:hypothetical protein
MTGITGPLMVARAGTQGMDYPGEEGMKVRGQGLEWVQESLLEGERIPGRQPGIPAAIFHLLRIHRHHKPSHQG